MVDNKRTIMAYIKNFFFFFLILQGTYYVKM